MRFGSGMGGPVGLERRQLLTRLSAKAVGCVGLCSRVMPVGQLNYTWLLGPTALVRPV
jgi:hypothetical protein